MTGVIFRRREMNPPVFILRGSLFSFTPAMLRVVAMLGKILSNNFKGEKSFECSTFYKSLGSNLPKTACGR